MAIRTGIIYSAKKPKPAKKKIKKIKNRQTFASFLGRFLNFLGKPFVFILFGIAALLIVLINLFIKTFLSLKIFAKTLLDSLQNLSLPKPKIPNLLWDNFIFVLFKPFKFPIFRFIFFLLIPIVVSLTAVFIYFYIFKDLPNPNRLINRDQAVSTKIYDRNGELLYKIYRNQNRTLVKLDQVPKQLQEAVIAIEDKDFYKHQGLSVRGILRSLYQNLSQGKLNGGSTITQQLVKNALLTPEKTWQRKIKETILAVKVETQFSKEEILQMYLNEVGFGGAAYGIEEAAELYFGKHVWELDLAQSSLLAGLPGSPTNFSPFGAHPEKAKERQELVLQRMLEDGYIDVVSFQKTRIQKLEYIPNQTEIKAPHFVMFVKDLLVKKYGERVVDEGGLEVTTSLDLILQEKAQKIVKDEVESLKKLRITNGAALITKPKTGEILAMVGSIDYFNRQNQGNFNVTTGLRQPGSSIKPINYAVALQNGFTPATLIPDTPITFKTAGQPPYSPINYDNSYHGNVTLRQALACSYNVPAVKVLAAMGVNRMIDQGEKMGITTWQERNRFGLSLTLGGGEVKMTDMAVAYGSLANLGVKVTLNPILEVKNYKGKVLESISKIKTEEIALNPQVAFILNDILADNTARTPTFGANSQLVIPGKTVAVKTGTTNNLKDNWTIGYTPSYLVASWVGNNDATPMSYVASGVTGASPIWHKIMEEVLKNQLDEKFALPENLKKVEICTLTGSLSCGACPTKKWEIFLPETEPKNTCSEEEIKKILEEKEKKNNL